MNFEVNKIRVDEVEINIKSIIAQCLRKWKLIFVLMLLFAILVSGFKFAKDTAEYNIAFEAQEAKQQTIELTDADKVAIDSYYLLQSRKEQLQDYGANSLLVRMDVNNVCQGTVLYHVKADEAIQYDVANAMVSYANNGGLAVAISESLGNIEAKYAQEVLAAEISGTGTGIESSVIRLRILGCTKDECLAYIAKANEAMEAYAAKLAENMGTLAIEVIQEEFIAGFRSDIYNSQKTYYKDCTNIEIEIATQIATLTDTQKLYIAEHEAEDGNADSDIGEISKPVFSAIYAVVGAILGAVLAVGIVLITVLFGGRLQSEKELLKRLNVVHLGSIRATTNSKLKNVIDRLLYGKDALDEDKQIDLIHSRMSLCMDKNATNKVLLVSTTDTQDNPSWKKLEETLKKNGLSCEIVGNITKDQMAINALASHKNIVLVEAVGKSKVKDIYEEAMLCANAGVDVIGYIAVQA